MQSEYEKMIAGEIYRPQDEDLRKIRARSKEFPGYDFAQNAGYGTKSHLDGLERYGVSPIHRKTFEPVKSMLD